MAITRGLLRRIASSSLLSVEPEAVAVSGNKAPVPSSRLLVSGLNKQTTLETLTKAFSTFGKIVEGRIITDKASGLSKGFSFIRYRTIKEAELAIKGMDCQYLDGWIIYAEYAHERGPHENGHFRGSRKLTDDIRLNHAHRGRTKPVVIRQPVYAV